MENHFHAVVQSAQLPRVMAELKKFTAGKLLAQLKVEGRDWLLELRAAGKAEHKMGSLYQVWQEGYRAQAIYSDETMQQKIDYIHANRCGGAGWRRRSIGGIARRMSGSRSLCR
jgi:putative transposase